MKANSRIPLFLLFTLLIISVSCRRRPAGYILISREYNNVFRDWLSHVDDDLHFINMYTTGEDSLEYYLSIASGIIISGGPDVNPALYGKEDEVERCENIDYRRDTLELQMIKHALENKIPILGICRGVQILNIVYGGTLIIDIPADFDTLIKHRGQGNHWITLVEGTFLSEICRITGDSVNSSHHQAVENTASFFRPAAFAEDGLIEALELKEPLDHPFVLGVQWHPERMDPESPLVYPIAKRFIEEVERRE